MIFLETHFYITKQRVHKKEQLVQQIITDYSTTINEESEELKLLNQLVEERSTLN